MSVKSKVVYLSGPITGLDFKGCTDWREYASRAFPSFIEGVSPMRAQRHLESSGPLLAGNDAYRDHPTTTGRAMFARDKDDTVKADAILCNLLGAQRVSIGSVMEIAWAHLRGIPVIVAIEPEGNIHDHMMMFQSYDLVYHSLDEAIEGTVQWLAPHEKYMRTNVGMLRMAEGLKKLDLTTPALRMHG